MGKTFSLEHRRYFGAHVPWGHDFGKARDPHMNLRTLARLSYDGDPAVRVEVGTNLARKFETPLSARQIRFLSIHFNRSTIIVALNQTTKIDLYNSHFVADFMRSMNSLELEMLLQERHSKMALQILLDAAGHPLTPTDALLPLLKHSYAVEVGKATGKDQENNDRYRFPVRDVAASNLRQRLNQLDSETAMKVRQALQDTVFEEAYRSDIRYPKGSSFLKFPSIPGLNPDSTASSKP